MGTGYVRQSATTIIPGADIVAAPLNAEFNAIRDAFDGSAGHSHDGTTGEGQKIDLTTSVTGVLPVANGGIAGINNGSAVTAPTVTDDSGDGYAVGSLWINTATDLVYICVDSTLGAAVWVNLSSADAELQALSALTSAANKGIYFTGAGTAATYDLTAFARTILDDADASTVLTTLGITTLAKSLLDDTTTAQALTTLGISAFAQTLLDDTTASTYLTTLGFSTFVKSFIGGADAATVRTALEIVETELGSNLQAIADLVSAANKGIYFTGAGTASMYDLTAYARTLLDDGSALDARATLGLVIGTNVQAFNSKLSAIAALTGAADKGIMFTGSTTAATFDLTSFGRDLVASPTSTEAATALGFSAFGQSFMGTLDASAARTLLGLSSIVTFAKATSAEFIGNTANRILTPDIVWQAANLLALSDGVTITPNFAQALNFTVTLGGNRTLGAPTNAKPGQSGFIRVRQDATGNRTLALNAVWRTANGVTPDIEPTANAYTTLYYTVHDTTWIEVTYHRNVS